MKKNIAISVLFFLIFIIITIGLLTDNPFIDYIDEVGFSLIQKDDLRFLDYYNVIMSYMGEAATIIGFCAILLILPSRKNIGLPVAFLTGFSALLNQIIKAICARPRPDMSFFISNAPLNYQYPTSLSFPSGHSQSALVFYIALLSFFWLYRIKGDKMRKVVTVLAIILLLPIGVSRVYLGVHHLSDVIAGWSLGFVIVVLFLGLIDVLPVRRYVSVSIDKKLGTTDIDFTNLKYNVNVGFIDDLYIKNGERQRCYVLGINEPVDYSEGVLIAVIKRVDHIENIWVVNASKKKYNKDEIMRIVSFQEQDYEDKIYML